MPATLLPWPSADKRFKRDLGAPGAAESSPPDTFPEVSDTPPGPFPKRRAGAFTDLSREVGGLFFFQRVRRHIGKGHTAPPVGAGFLSQIHLKIKRRPTRRPTCGLSGTRAASRCRASSSRRNPERNAAVDRLGAKTREWPRTYASLPYLRRWWYPQKGSVLPLDDLRPQIKSLMELPLLASDNVHVRGSGIYQR